MTVSRELARYTLDLVGVQEVRWEGSGPETVGEYRFFYGKLVIEAGRYSETLVSISQITMLRIPGYCTLHARRLENLRSLPKSRNSMMMSLYINQEPSTVPLNCGYFFVI
jgi:hypothetical protein